MSEMSDNNRIIKVLIIEDEPQYLQSITLTLKMMGYETIEASDGSSGIEAIVQYKPNIVLCDINLPDVDGYTVLNMVRSQPELNSTPFMFLTGNAEKQDMRRGMEEGADDYITKPFTAEELLNAISAQLKKKNTIDEMLTNKLAGIKSHFIQSLPHEFRTPLNGILGFSSLLRDNPGIDHEEIQHMADLIYQSGTRLQHLLENILMFSTIQLIKANPTDYPEVFTDITDIAECIEAPIYKLKRKYKRANDIKYNIVNHQVNAKMQFLIKVFDEIIDNAFKFSKDNTPIYIDCYIEDNHYVINIEDQGKGLNKEQVKNISVFTQFERETNEQQGGGMGLALSQAIIEIYNGSISFDSCIGKGTKVQIRIPIDNQNI